MEKQRDQGIFGALIVKEDSGVIDELFTYPIAGKQSDFEDRPDKHTLSITEHMKLDNKAKSQRECTEDSSAVPVKGEHVSSYQINGVKLDKAISEEEQVRCFKGEVVVL